ncbi:hypothetical protein [Pseudomonas benzenivorans]|uniref:hypothetical protein n=1 Tax=Pseudomonas benzenivorans TaxID=556533 RepID=UPI0035186EAD
MRDFYLFVVLIVSLASIGQFSIAHYLPAFNAIGNRPGQCPGAVPKNWPIWGAPPWMLCGG